MPQPSIPIPPPATSGQPLDRLVQLLVNLEGPPQDRGALSALRSWWRPASRHLALPVMADLLARSGIGTGRLDDPVWTALPALFAWYRRHESGGRTNFGTTCRRLAGDQRETFDTHFRRVLAAEDIETLVGIIRRHLLRAGQEIALDYKKLGIDLLQWRKSPESAREVKVRWAKEYFRAPAEEPTPDAP